MASFRCTAKLLKEMGAKPGHVPPENPDDWHANLIRYGPKKLVLFCSSSTLFACLTPPVTRAQIREPESIFLPALEAAMHADGYSASSIAYCKRRFSGMKVSKTIDRSVLGTMTDYLYHIDAVMNRFGGIDRCDFGYVSSRLNEIPQVKREFFNANEAFGRSLIRVVD